jgi:hypothetical protein
MLITGRRRQRPRRGFVPQAQAAQQRQKHVSAPPSYGQVNNFSKAHRREELLASVQMKLVILTPFVCTSAECSSPAATATRCPQAAVWAPTWAPRSVTCAHVNSGAPTPEATPRLCAAGAGGVTVAKTCICRLERVSAPPNYGQVSSSSKIHRREGHLACVQMKLVIFTLLFCPSAKCSYPAVAASRRRRQRPGHRTGHQNQVPAMHSERRRGQRPRNHGQVYLRRTRSGSVGNGLGTSIKCL